MLIEKVPSIKDKLRGKIAIITGAGGGIGLETAKALCYLGAKVVILEIDKIKGQKAEKEINTMFGSEIAEYYYLDLSKENEINSFAERFREKYGCPSIIINNAATIIIGAIDQLSPEEWDVGYRVNLKAPILLTKEFLPQMKKANKGTICFIPSSGAAPYMGAYEVFKTAQAEFCSTLCGELESTSVYAYSIAPGLVKTETADKSIEKVAGMMGISKSSIYTSNEKNMLSAEEAGTALALSVLAAEKYNGLEIGSIQVLNDFCLLDINKSELDNYAIACEELEVVNRIVNTFKEQHKGWKERNVFERQWLMRDFKKTVGYTSDQMELKLVDIYEHAKDDGKVNVSVIKDVFERLKSYYINQYTLLQGWEKNKEKLENHSLIISGWINDIDSVIKVKIV